ncbi:MAG: ABC transporter ATP-binding protein [Betaproteobacteria bacterium]|nr:ABC transporter ATP-binding protein [Betaproteobacteria bacterium]MBU6513844.1 ABC transporter ATP-binding protein [Betaproteobacteria bacterium]MDE1956419.1 ABC transporter ATP-binding protein [Betaproteobacteria bacterium]MDE2152745.1 ABC transporter ATP-binding protein [Betaproteobacteria bacterium]
MRDGAALLRLRAAELRAGSQCLVREPRLDVQPGQRWALIGRNGAGKSTLLRLLAGLLEPHGATVELAGEALPRVSPARLARLRAYMPAQPHDRFGISVLDALMLGQPEPDEQRALHWLQAVDALALARRSLLRLSSGERQRVALAQVLAQDTALLLLDEPVSFQDPRHQASLAKLLGRHLAPDGPRALVFSAHDLNWVAALATHVLALLPDGAWTAGEASRVLCEDTLGRAYGCAWQRIARPGRADLWIAGD